MTPHVLCALDYDGVIVDSMDHNLAASQRACACIGHTRLPTREDVLASDTMTFEAIALNIGIPPARMPEFLRHLGRELTAGPMKPALFAGIDEAMERLALFCALAVVTANRAEIVAERLEEAGLRQHVTLLLGTETPGSKADKLCQAARDVDIPVSSVLMVGDCVSDICAAREAGAKAVAVTWGYHPRERLLAERPDSIVDSPWDIVEVVKQARRQAP